MGDQIKIAGTSALLRLRNVVGGLSSDDLARTIPSNGWTVATTLAHIAFWDLWVITRWEDFERRGSFEEIPSAVLDFVNTAAADQWAALPPEFARREVIDVAQRVVGRIESLSEEAIRAAVESGRIAMADRTLHWNPHLDEIEAVLGRA